jgi:hypothetical protein
LALIRVTGAIDVLAGDLNGRAAIWQAKYFIDGAGIDRNKERGVMPRDGQRWHTPTVWMV